MILHSTSPETCTFYPAFVILTLIMYYNFLDDCDWLIELSDNKLPNNKLSDNNLVSELVENTVEFFKPITLTARGCTGNTERCAVQVTIYKSCIIAVFLHVVHGKYRTTSYLDENGS